MLNLALAALVTFAPQGTEPLVRNTKHFRIVCHVSSDRAAAEAAETVETVWQCAAKLYDLSQVKLDEPLAVHLYPDAAAYEAAEAPLTQGRFKRNQALAHFETKTAHVALQPPIDRAVIDKYGLPMQTRRLLAHEAAHLVRYSVTRNYRSHPSWVANGTASFIDYEVMKKLGLVPEQNRDPFSGRTLNDVQALIRRNKLPSFEALLSGQKLELSFYEDYSYSWLFFQYLMDGKERQRRSMRRIMAGMRRLGGGGGFAKRLRKVVGKEFSRKRLEVLEEKFRKHISLARPQWNELFHSLETTGRTWRQMAFPSSNAIAWRTEPVAKADYSIRGALQILPGTKTQMNLLLDRRSSGFVSVAFTAGSGVTVFRFDARAREWNRLLYQPVDTLKVNAKIAFVVTVDKTSVAIELGGKPVAKVDVGGEPLDGAWGLGIQNGSAGLWHELEAPGLD